jgi:hypothetical protein
MCTHLSNSEWTLSRCHMLRARLIYLKSKSCKIRNGFIRFRLSVKGRHIKVIAKIQNRKALQNFEEILGVADGIIIARGYLGLDLKLEDVAYVQKYLIK